MQDSLPAGGLRLCRAGVEPAGSLREVSVSIHNILLSRAYPGAITVRARRDGWPITPPLRGIEGDRQNKGVARRCAGGGKGFGKQRSGGADRPPPPHQPSPDGSASATPPQGGSDSAAAAEGWRHMRVNVAGTERLSRAIMIFLAQGRNMVRGGDPESRVLMAAKPPGRIWTARVPRLSASAKT